ncbi:MAG: TonB-dependent receptor, partial [Segetibacter sp.]|nr:TonB-dependent receptor [Segetibacter sp.]
ITNLAGGQALFAGGVGGNQGNITKSDNGQPIGSFFILEADGIFQTEAEIAASAQKDARPGDLRYKDIGGGADGKPDGKIDANDRAYQGSYQPKLTFGFNGGVNYQAFDFSFNTYGTAGGKIYNGKKAARVDPRDNIETEVVLNRWTPNNRNTNIPRANLNQLPASTYFLEKGDFWRINNLTLGYAIPKSALSRYNIQRLRVYATVQNLATITGYSGFTPEILGGGTLAGGIELGIYPTTRTFAFGVNLGL